MKIIMFFALVFLFSTAQAVTQMEMMSGLQDFSAPIVNDKDGLENTVPAGTIVYENENDSFHGLRPDGTWASMGGNVNTVIAPSGSSGTKVASARISVTAANACSVSSQDGSWINTCTGASSVFTLNLITSPATFSAAPHCVCAPESNTASVNNSCQIYSTPTTSAVVVSMTDKVGATNVSFHIICVGAQ